MLALTGNAFVNCQKNNYITKKQTTRAAWTKSPDWILEGSDWKAELRKSFSPHRIQTLQTGFEYCFIFLFVSVSFSFFCPFSSWVRWRWTGRSSRSTVRCSLRPWGDPWTPWTPWTRSQCQGALGCEATATWGQSTRAVQERKRGREGGPCSYCHLPHPELLPPLWEPFKAAQVNQINKISYTNWSLLDGIGLCWGSKSWRWSIARCPNTFQDPEVVESCHSLFGKRDDAGLLKPAGVWLHFANEVLKISEHWRELMSVAFQSGWRARAPVQEGSLCTWAQWGHQLSDVFLLA